MYAVPANCCTKITIGAILFTDLFENDFRSGRYELIYNVVNYMTGIIPHSFVTIGCVVIGAQLVVPPKKQRQQFISGQTKKSANKKSTSKTTKTLLSICVFYSVCSGFSFAIA